MRGYGFAVMKGKNQTLVDGFNKALTEMKSNGDYDKILKKYCKKVCGKSCRKGKSLYLCNRFREGEPLKMTD